MQIIPFWGNSLTKKREKIMNKKYIPIAMLAMAAFASAELMFDVAVGERVCTGGFDCTVETPETNKDDGGFWFDYDDRKNDKGSSFVTYPVEKNEYESYITPMIEKFNMISITMTAGPDAEYPFVGFGFNLVNGAKDGYDIGTNWGSGVCITLANSAKLSMELEYIGDGANTKYDEYAATIPAATVGRAVDLAWSDFDQAGWGTAVAQATVLSNTVAVKLKFAGTAGKTLTNSVQIGYFGTTGSCPATLPPSTAIPSVNKASSVKAQLDGRRLSFPGLKSAANVEIINLQGQVVLKSSLNGSASLNLANLDAGVYMVRIAGKSVNFAQKVLLK